MTVRHTCLKINEMAILKEAEGKSKEKKRAHGVKLVGSPEKWRNPDISYEKKRSEASRNTYGGTKK